MESTQPPCSSLVDSKPAASYTSTTTNSTLPTSSTILTHAALQIPEIVIHIIERMSFADILLKARLLNHEWKCIIDETPSILRTCWRHSSTSGKKIIIPLDPNVKLLRRTGVDAVTRRLALEAVMDKWASQPVLLPALRTVIEDFRQTVVYEDTDEWETHRCSPEHAVIHCRAAGAKNCQPAQPILLRTATLNTTKGVPLNITHMNDFLLSHPRLKSIELSVRMSISTAIKRSSKNSFERGDRDRSPDSNYHIPEVIREEGVTVGDVLKAINEIDYGRYWPEYQVTSVLWTLKDLGSSRTLKPCFEATIINVVNLGKSHPLRNAVIRMEV